MPNLNHKVKVCLTDEQRQEFQEICRARSVAAGKVRRARALLMSDENHPDGRRRDWEIAESLEISERQVVRIRQQFAREGAGVLEPKPRPAVPGKLDGRAEAMLISLCCGDAPDGREHWTLQLLCDALVRLQVVESVCRETVRQTLKKTRSSPGVTIGFASPKPTGRGSSPAWKRCSMSTRSLTTSSIR